MIPLQFARRNLDKLPTPINVTPLEGQEFSLTRPRAERRCQDRVVPGMVRLRSFQQGTSFLRRQEIDLLPSVARPDIPARSLCRVGSEDAVLDGVIENGRKRSAHSHDGASGERLRLAAIGKLYLLCTACFQHPIGEGLHVIPRDLVERLVTELGEKGLV
jgi:hypothetical protein